MTDAPDHVAGDSSLAEEAEAARLRARLERGELPRERLTLAAFLGHEPSRRALGRAEDADEEPAPTLEFWGRRLARWGPPVMLRTGAALGRHLAAVTAPPEEVAAALRQATAAIDAFLARREPSETAARLAATEQAATATARAALSLDPEAPARRACQVALPTLRAVIDLLRGEAVDRTHLDAHYLRALQQAEAAGVGLEELRAAVSVEVLAWALAAAPPAPGPHARGGAGEGLG